MDQKQSPGQHLKIRRDKVRMELHKMRKINAEDEASIKAEWEKIGEATYLKQFKNIAKYLDQPSQDDQLNVVKKLRRMSNEACITPSFLVNELPSFYHSIFDHLSYSDTDPLLRIELTCILANLSGSSGEENINPLKHKGIIQILWTNFRGNHNYSEICANVLKTFTNLSLQDSGCCIEILGLDILKELKEIEDNKGVNGSILIEALQLFKAAVQTLKGKFPASIVRDVVHFAAACLTHPAQGEFTASINLIYDLTNQIEVSRQYAIQEEIHGILVSKFQTKKLDLLNHQTIILILGNLLIVESESALIRLFQETELHSLIATELLSVSSNQQEIKVLGASLLFAMSNLIHSERLLPINERPSHNEDFINLILQYSEHSVLNLRKEGLFNIAALLKHTPPHFDGLLLKQIQTVLMKEENASLLMIALQGIQSFMEKEGLKDISLSDEEELIRKSQRADALKSMNFIEILESLSSRVQEPRIIEEVTDIMDGYLMGTEDCEGESGSDEEEKIEI